MKIGLVLYCNKNRLRRGEINILAVYTEVEINSQTKKHSFFVFGDFDDEELQRTLKIYAELEKWVRQ